jgi:DNA-directed RNA polymerase
MSKFKLCSELSRLVTQALQNKASGPYKLMKWMQEEIADPCSIINIPIKWTSAVGNPITQAKYLKETKRVTVPWGQYDTVRPSLAYNTTQIDQRKQRNALPANRTHELDSSHLVMIVNECKKKGIELITIHDCFSTHPNDIDDLRSIIWEKFKELYAVDRAYDLSQCVNEYYKEGLNNVNADIGTIASRLIMLATHPELRPFTEKGNHQLPEEMPLYFFR